MEESDFLIAGVYLVAQIAAYLIGGIPFGLFIARRFGKVDIRTVGSGNIGATNVGRTLGFRFFLLVFLLDFLKGAIPVGIALWMRSAQPADGNRFLFLPEAVGLAAILGHVFPIYLRFKGGKGVATTLGVIVPLAPVPASAALATWLLAMAVWRIVSLASMLATAGFVVAHFVVCPAPFGIRYAAGTAFVLLVAGLIVARHIPNLRRLLAGTEPRVSFTKKRDLSDSATGVSNAS